jgi:hypothetical protein
MHSGGDTAARVKRGSTMKVYKGTARLAEIIASVPAEGSARDSATIAEVDRSDDALLGGLFHQATAGALSVEAYGEVYRHTDPEGRFVDDAWRLIAARLLRD